MLEDDSSVEAALLRRNLVLLVGFLVFIGAVFVPLRLYVLSTEPSRGEAVLCESLHDELHDVLENIEPLWMTMESRNYYTTSQLSAVVRSWDRQVDSIASLIGACEGLSVDGRRHIVDKFDPSIYNILGGDMTWRDVSEV